MVAWISVMINPAMWKMSGEHSNVVDFCDVRGQHNGVGPHRWAKLTTCTGSACASMPRLYTGHCGQVVRKLIYKFMLKHRVVNMSCKSQVSGRQHDLDRGSVNCPIENWLMCPWLLEQHLIAHR